MEAFFTLVFGVLAVLCGALATITNDRKAGAHRAVFAGLFLICTALSAYAAQQAVLHW